MFSRFPLRRCSRSSRLLPFRPGDRSPSQCQELQPGWDQQAWKRAEVWLAGAGGLGSEMALTFVQSGVGRLVIVEPDIVEASNLHRQFFRPKDIGRGKAMALARNITKFGGLGTVVEAHGVYLESFLGVGRPRPNLVVVGVDNDQARVSAAEYCLNAGVPLVNVGHSRDGEGLQVFVQEPGGACFGCFRGEGELGRAPCGGLPVDKTLCQMAGALAARAAMSVVMPRPREWQSLTFFPDAGTSIPGTVEIRSGCSLCGGKR